MNINEIARILDRAAHDAKSIEQISHSHQISLNQAYSIQKCSIDERLHRGEKLVGYKMGFTSREKMDQMGVHDLIWGRLTDTMQIPNNGSLEFSNYIHPRAEPEICFLIKENITKPLTMDNVVEFIDGYAAAIEIIDSRFENFKFSLEDVIADNCSSTGFVIGSWHQLETCSDLSIALKVNGNTVHQGNSNAILGNPLESLVEASRLITQAGEVITKGQIILAGAATPAEFVNIGQRISTDIEKLGSLSLNII